MNFLVHLVTQGYAAILHLYPLAFRQELGAEMQDVFGQVIAEASQGGWGAIILVFWRELRDLPGNLAAAQRSHPQGEFKMKRNGFFLVTLFVSIIIVQIAFGSYLGGIWTITIGLVVAFPLSLLLWQARKLRTKTLIYIGLGVLLGLLWPTSSLVESEKFYNYHLPQPYLSIVNILVFSCFLLAVVMAAAMIDQAAQILHRWLNLPPTKPGELSAPTKRDDWTLPALFGLSSALLLMFFHNLSDLLMWDNTYDALGGLWLILPVITCLLCGMVLALNLPGKSKWISLLFILFIPLMIYTLSIPAMNIDVGTLTRERGERLTYAIQTYYQREGHYPQTLARLTPRDLRMIQPPFVLNGQNWCYDAGQHYYRLGYVDREHWSAPEYRGNMLASAGDLSGLPPVCQAAIAKLSIVYKTADIQGSK